MLAIRLQRIGRKGQPIYRLAVQESQRHPSSGRVVSYVGSFNPHSKALTMNKEKIGFYLENGAQPTSRVVRLLKEEKIALPAWIKDVGQKKHTIKHTTKLRKNQPKEEAPASAEAEVPAEPAAGTETISAAKS